MISKSGSVLSARKKICWRVGLSGSSFRALTLAVKYLIVWMVWCGSSNSHKRRMLSHL